MRIDLPLQAQQLATLIGILQFFTLRQGVLPVFPVGHPFIDKGDHGTHNTTIQNGPPYHTVQRDTA